MIRPSESAPARTLLGVSFLCLAAAGASPVGRGSALVTGGLRYRPIADSAPQLAYEMLIAETVRGVPVVA